MSTRLDQIKLGLISSVCQVSIFTTKGKILESCDTLLKTDRSSSIFTQFDFLESLADALKDLVSGESLDFDLVEWEEQVSALFSLRFEKSDPETIFWIIRDESKNKEHLRTIQQERNDAAINEEFLEIQRKYLEVEKELLDYKNEELRRIQKFKEQFFAEVSHEMRTPLNSISGLTELLYQENEHSRKEYLNALKATSNHLNAIINDVLDLSKIEAGKLKLDQRTFDLHETVDTIITGFSMTAAEKGIKLSAKIDNKVPQKIIGDPIRISQVLYNLIGNAIKFTEKGSVILAVSLPSVDEGKIILNFSIKDTGKGISKSDLAKVLEAYGQAEGQQYYHFGGTGLGLGIAQQLIKLMHGKLEIDSKEGKGTLMSFSVIVEKSMDEPEGQGSEPEKVKNMNLSHLSILFAEDDQTSRLMLQGLAHRHRLNADFVSTCLTLRKALKKAEHNLIVCDVQLSDGQSIDEIKNLREKGQMNQKNPIIFISGDPLENHPELNELSGWQYLMKPINPNLLVAMIIEMTEDMSPKDYEVNLDNLRTSAQNDSALMKMLIDTIVETLPQELENLSNAIQKSDHEQARKILHKIKPSISYLGIKQLMDQRNSMYELAHEEKPIADFDIFRVAVEASLKQLVAMKNSLD